MSEGWDNNLRIHCRNVSLVPACKWHIQYKSLRFFGGEEGLCALSLASFLCPATQSDTASSSNCKADLSHSVTMEFQSWWDTGGILFCGFRLHKHHYHLPDLELLSRSAATPILSGTSNGDARGLSGSRVNKKESGVCGTWVWERVRMHVRVLTQSSFQPAVWNRQQLSSKQSFLTVPLPDLNCVEH